MKSIFFLIACVLMISCGGNNSGDKNVLETTPAKDTSAKPPADSQVITNNDTAASNCGLVEKIQELQALYVRASYGVNAGECFTDVDLKTFKDNGVPRRIAQELGNHTDFTCIINTLRNMTPQNRASVLRAAAKTYKLSWDELGMNPAATSREQLKTGQTNAGKEAEMLIAQAIVGLVNERLRT